MGPNQFTSHTSSISCSRDTTAPALRIRSRSTSNSLRVSSSGRPAWVTSCRAGSSCTSPTSSGSSPAGASAGRARRSTARMRATSSRALNGFTHVVVGAHLEADDPVRLLAARGEHDDRHLGAAAQLAAHVVAGAVGQHHVQQHQVGRQVAGQRDALGRRARDRAVEALPLERLGERGGDRGLVLDHQDRAPSVRHQR